MRILGRFFRRLESLRHVGRLGHRSRRLESLRHSRRRGMILILMMWISAALVGVALNFGDSMIVEYRAADNALASQEAQQAIEGARRYVAQILTDNPEPGRMPDPTTYESEKVPVGKAAFWIIGRPADGASVGSALAFGLVDEGAKLNLNTATAEMLAALPGMTPEFAAAIVDWRDADEDLTPGGAESQNYLLLTPPYNCKNAAFESPEELCLVMGSDLATLYGSDTNRNGIVDPSEGEGAYEPGLLEYVTVFSREPDTREDGTARINIAQSAPAVWQLLTDTLGQDRSDAVRAAIGNNLPNVKSVLEFYGLSGLDAADFAQVEDALTVSTRPFIDGRVNVNSAPTAVLACVPGVGTDYAAQIATARQGQAAEDLQSIAWVGDILGPEASAQAGPYLTTRSYQFSADVAAVGRRGRGFRRDHFVFDTTGTSPVLLYRRDRTHGGWPLGSAIREQYQSQETP